jgi:hypothetical protein
MKSIGSIRGLLIMLFSIQGGFTSGQTNMDSLLVNLNNKDVKFKIFLRQSYFENGELHPFVIHRTVTSVNLTHIIDSFPKYPLISRLVKLLDDSNRDWYANLLLFSLTGLENIGTKGKIMFIKNREDWLKPAFEKSSMSNKYLDERFWQNYLFNLLPSDNWTKKNEQ